MENILVIDDEREVGNFLKVLLNEKGHNVTLSESGKQTKDLLNQGSYGLAIIDVRLPDASGLDLLKDIRRKLPACKIIIMTGYSTVKTAVEAIKLGADDYIEKPFDDIDQLEKQIDDLLVSNNELASNTINTIANEIGFLIGKHPEMKHLAALAYKIASKNVNVLIEGETGTGKEVLARFIHQASSRRDQSFIGINCGALSHSLLESELFGHEKGAFTGAANKRRGIFEIASQGTLLLDEIAETTTSIQVKLLRVLETREYMRIGGEKSQRTNTRIIAASHTNLKEAVTQNKFREDLFYRLDVVKLFIPPLQERPNDVPLFVDHFLKKNLSNLKVSEESMYFLKKYSWPGNIRELSNTIVHLISLNEGEKSVITPDDLPEKIVSDSRNRTTLQKPRLLNNKKTMDLETYLADWKNKIIDSLENFPEQDFAWVEMELRELQQQVSKAFVNESLSLTGGNRKDAARRLNISQRKLRYILNEKDKIIKEQTTLKTEE
ncbi:sigma-54-dependent transcriptional regulator [Halobacillus andaensis]|uniref:sigma-54-dependent transcriptional regulator n=1 Tax=Halobacillus andaensis TaxID=1176239 RepID=UPI003D73E0C0